MPKDRELVKPWRGKEHAITPAESKLHQRSQEKYTNCKVCGKPLKDSESKEIGLCITHQDAVESKTDKFRITRQTESQSEFQ